MTQDELRRLATLEANMKHIMESLGELKGELIAHSKMDVTEFGEIKDRIDTKITSPWRSVLDEVAKYLSLMLLGWIAYKMGFRP